MNTSFVPGRNAAAQGWAKVPRSVVANLPENAAPVAVGDGVDVALVEDPLLQLAAMSRGARVAAMIEKRLMYSSSPVNGLGGAPLVVGVDEAGRGPLAGPVVAAAVVLCKPCPRGLDDSKKLSAKCRSELEPQILSRCAWGLAVVEPEEIDRLNIFAATMWAMTLAVTRLVEALGRDPDAVLIDGNMTPHGRHPDWRWADARPIVGGDGKEQCIGAASIIAKEHRDRLMLEAAREHPHYGWERNKGYGSAEHMEALRVHGPTPLHRKSFAPVSQLALL